MNPTTPSGRDLLDHAVQYDPRDADRAVTGAKIAEVEREAVALYRKELDLSRLRAIEVAARRLLQALDASDAANTHGWAEALRHSEAGIDVERLGSILAGYRLLRSPYYSPNLIGEIGEQRMMTAEEWAAEIARAYAASEPETPKP